MFYDKENTLKNSLETYSSDVLILKKQYQVTVNSYKNDELNYSYIENKSAKFNQNDFDKIKSTLSQNAMFGANLNQTAVNNLSSSAFSYYYTVQFNNAVYLSENNSIFIYNGVVTADSYNSAPVNIYIDNRSCGNNIAILNHSEYINDKTNIVGLLATDTIDNTIKRKVLNGSVTVGSNTIAVGDTVRTPIRLDGFIKKSGIWFPINIKSSDNANNITAYVTNSSIMLDTTVDGNYIIVLDYT
jgi:hypothetical protein